VFVFWSVVALTLSLGHGVVYASTDFIHRNTAWDLLLPVTAVRLLSGAVAPLDRVGILKPRC